MSEPKIKIIRGGDNHRLILEKFGYYNLVKRSRFNAIIIWRRDIFECLTFPGWCGSVIWCHSNNNWSYCFYKPSKDDEVIEVYENWWYFLELDFLECQMKVLFNKLLENQIRL